VTGVPALQAPSVLVVGGTGVAGGAAIAAVREAFGDAAGVTALWYGPKEEDIAIKGADHTIFGDVTGEETCRRIADRAGEDFDYLFFATARGEVGFPVGNSTAEQIAEACRLSFDPLPFLEERFNVGTLVAYSTFYSLNHQMANYGAMGYAKERVELWTIGAGRSRHVCLRAGAFESQSSRAIMLMLRKNARNLSTSEHPLISKYFSGRKPSEAARLLAAGTAEEERKMYGDSGTTAADLVQAHLYLLAHPDALFVNVCGSRIWVSSEVQRLDPPGPA
jgi:hypothetical protein